MPHPSPTNTAPETIFAELRIALDALSIAEAEAAYYYDASGDPWTRDDQVLLTEDDVSDFGEGATELVEALEEAWAEVWALVRELEDLGHAAAYEESVAVPVEAEERLFIGEYECAVTFGGHDLERWTERVRGEVPERARHVVLTPVIGSPIASEMFFVRLGFERRDGSMPTTLAAARTWAGIG